MTTSKEQLIKQAQKAAIAKRLSSAAPEADITTQRAVTKLLKAGGAVGQQKWWERADEQPEEEDEEDGGDKWKHMEHHGVLFPPEYVAHGIQPKIKGETVQLEVAQEEAVSWWAAAEGTDFGLKDKVRTNVLKGLNELLPEGHHLSSLKELDVSEIKVHLEAENEKRKARDPVVKKEEAAQRKKVEEFFAFANIDGQLERLDGCMIEPPGLFRGRGEHPLAGTFKRRIQPEQVTVNCGPYDPIPKCPLPGHSWKAVVHKQDATWLMSYKDSQRNHLKYIFLAANSRFKGRNDMKKYEKARALKARVEDIRAKYRALMKDSDATQCQLATATYLIDFLALRVGNEKGEDEADTVGCCSIRVEHVDFLEDNQVTFDFLGKDSMRYLNTVKLSQQGWENLKSFAKNKNPKEDLFHLVSASRLNDFLKQFMPGLSAKVFRTYNASCTLEQELGKGAAQELEAKLDFYEEANRQVAILCNHQKTVAKNFDEQVHKMRGSLEAKKEKLSMLEGHARAMKREEKAQEKASKAGERAKKAAEKGVKLPKTASAATAMAEKLKKSLQREEKKLAHKELNRNISLGTSRLNYMDPRITIAWCKRGEVPIEKLFTQKLRDKFCWAMDVEPEFKF